MIEVEVNKRKRLFPQTWAELAENTDNLIYILNLFFCELTQQQLLCAAAIRFMNLSGIMETRIQNAIKTHPELPHTQVTLESIYRATELIHFIVQTPPKKVPGKTPHI